MRLMISIVMAGFLVACGDKDAEDTAVEAEEVAEEVEEETEPEDSGESEEEESEEEDDETESEEDHYQLQRHLFLQGPYIQAFKH